MQETGVGFVRVVAAMLVVVMLVGCVGCAYYRVTDPTTDKIYYTRHLQESSAGSVKFQEAETDKTVILDTAEIEQISEDEYNVGLYAE